ncbi:MAG: class I SAM-dependent methyltransferase, partial [Candidatus Omnitrophota bacterium]
MKKLSNFLAIISVLLVVYSTLVKIIGQSMIDLGFIGIKISSGLILATFLMLTAVLLKISSKKDNSYLIMQDIKILFWPSSILLIGLFSFFLISSAAKFTEKLNDQKIIEKFHKIYYSTKPYHTYYLGIPSMQYPNDNWVMQEIISEIKPDLIIETGTSNGGTSLFYATILEKVNEKGKVITVDIENHNPKVFKFKTWRERVEFIKGNSVSPEVTNAIAKQVKNRKVLVTLDSCHSKDHVLKELKLYSPFVSLNSYIVVQDT